MEYGKHRTLLRFRSKLGERKKLGPVTTLDVVKLYGEELVELKRDSKNVIKDLAAAAVELKEHADGIAIAICDRIRKVSMGEQKLSSLYLLDCIVKNDIDSPVYPKYFEACLAEVFDDTYRKLSSNKRFYMHRLFNSWSPYFSRSVLSKIKVGLYLDQDLSSNLIHCESQSPHLHGINDHQEYLEAHYQSVHSALDAQPARLPSCLQSCRQKSSFQYGENDLDSHVLLSPHPEHGRIGTTVEGGVDDIKPHPRLSSSPRVELTINTSPKRVVQGSSLFVCGSGRPGDRNGRFARIQPSGSGVQNPEASVAYGHNNGCDKMHARLLTEAYGNEDASHDKLPKVQLLNFGGISSDSVMKDSQSVEELYGWETMSPTFPRNCKQYNSSPFEHSTSLTQPHGVYLGKGFGSDWHEQALQPQPDDLVNTIDPGRWSFSDKRRLDGLASHKEQCPQYQTSYQAEEPVTFSKFFPQPSQQTFTPGLLGKLLQISCSASGAATNISEKNSSPLDDSLPDEVPSFRLSSSYSGYFKGETSTMEGHLAEKQYSGPSHPHVRSSFDFGANKHIVHTRPNPPSFFPMHEFDTSKRTKFTSIGLDQQSCHEKNNLNLQSLHGKNEFVGVSTEIQGRYAPFASASACHLVPQTSSHVLAQGTVITSAIAPSPLQHPLSSSRPLYPSSICPLHPSAAAPPPPYHHHPAPLHHHSAPFPHSMLPRPFHPIPAPLPPLHHHSAPFPHSMPPRPFHPIPAPLPPLHHHSAPYSHSVPSRPFHPIPVPVPPITASLHPIPILSPLVITQKTSTNRPSALPLQPSGPPLASSQVGIDFIAEFRKVQHESSINALYGDLPRQCTACGMRFKSQKEHSSHMNWHVIENQIVNNHKQKPSRNWYVSALEWISGAKQ